MDDSEGGADAKGDGGDDGDGFDVDKTNGAGADGAGTDGAGADDAGALVERRSGSLCTCPSCGFVVLLDTGACG